MNSESKEVRSINQITEGVIWKQLLLFFFPILFGTFFQQLYNTADAVIVGNFVGKEALAAVGGSASIAARAVRRSGAFSTPASSTGPSAPCSPRTCATTCPSSAP